MGKSNEVVPSEHYGDAVLLEIGTGAGGRTAGATGATGAGAIGSGTGTGRIWTGAAGGGQCILSFGKNKIK